MGIFGFILFAIRRNSPKSSKAILNPQIQETELSEDGREEQFSGRLCVLADIVAVQPSGRLAPLQTHDAPSGRLGESGTIGLPSGRLGAEDEE